MPLYYAIGLLLLFYILLVGEFFLPTGGLMGIAAVVTAIAAISVAFTHSMSAGVAMVMVIAATTPVVFMASVRLWPHTPIGRRILNRKPGEIDTAPTSKLADGTPLAELVGKTGEAQTDLLPSGQVIIDGAKLNAVSTGMAIDRGTQIVVVKVVAGKVQVRPSDRDNAEPVPETPQSPRSLESPLETLDVDSLD